MIKYSYRIPNTNELSAFGNSDFDYLELSCDYISSLSSSDFDLVKNDYKMAMAYDLLPERISIVNSDIFEIEKYLDTILARLKKAGIKYVTLGSLKSRQIPKKCDFFSACNQFEAFLNLFVEVDRKYDITLLVDLYGKKETKLLNNVNDLTDMVKSINSPKVKASINSLYMYEDNMATDSIHNNKDIIGNAIISSKKETAKYNSHYISALVAAKFDGIVTLDNVALLSDIKAQFANPKDTLIKITTNRALIEEPIFVTPFEGAISEDIKAIKTSDGRVFPAQKMGDGVLAIVTAKKKETILAKPHNIKRVSSVNIAKNSDYSYEIKIGNNKFSNFVYGGFDGFKPYFGPVLDNDGNSFTRCENKAKEHPHHRGLFVGIGDVNGVDLWSEFENSGHANVVDITNIETGSAYGKFDVNTVWVDSKGTPLVDENTTYTVYNQSESARYVDVKIVFKASYTNVKFAKTKEAGPLAIRLNNELREDKGTGKIVNSYGAVGENECWSKIAEWVDYSGKIKDTAMGVTVFDNPTNVNYPTSWHVRSYGLLAANNLMSRGEVNIKKGETYEYNFRIIFHKGKFTRDDITNRFITYIK